MFGGRAPASRQKFSPANCGGGRQQLASNAMLTVAVVKQEPAVVFFKHRDIGYCADAKCADVAIASKDFRRPSCRHFDDSLERHAQHEKLAHGGRHVEDRTMQILGVQVRTDRGRFKTLLERRLNNVPLKAAEPVSHIEYDAPLSRIADGRVNPPVFVRHSRSAALKAMRHTIAGRQGITKIGNRHGAFADVYHEPGFGITSSPNCIIEIRPALLPFADDVLAGADFHSDSHIRVAAYRLDDAIRISIAAVNEFSQVRGDKADARQIDETQQVGLATINAVSPKGAEIVRTRSARIQQGGDASRGAERVWFEAKGRMGVGMHVEIDQPGRDEHAVS